jgi:hydrogenase maturation factor HypF (carbamoyltransferase family)
MQLRCILQASTPVMSEQQQRLRMFLIPCSCGKTFAVSEDYDRNGTNWTRYLICPSCGKRHNPKNRLLRIDYQPEGYWRIGSC